MARGKPTKHVEMTVKQTIAINKSGFTLVVYDKRKQRLHGTLVVSVGGLSWYPSKRRGHHHTWDDLSNRMTR